MSVQLWPPVDEPRYLTRQVWDSTTARGLPGVGRALDLYSGLIGSCQLQQDVKGAIRKPGVGRNTAPRLCRRPDPDMARATFVRAHIEDWWLHGNATHLVTVRDAEGQPAAVRWYPAHRWYMDDTDGPVKYFLDGREVPRDDVVHVARGADPSFPYRGMGVVEQYLRALNRAGLEEAAESASLTDRGMPSVAIITPNAEPVEEDMDAAADKWVERFTGATPKPAFFPKDTQVVPLSWSPNDAQMAEARRLTRVDVANLMNLDGYWLGAEGSSHTYRSPGLMFLALHKTSLKPVMDVFEDVWSDAWFPNGTGVRFDPTELLRDDLGTMVKTFTEGAAMFPPEEARVYMGFPAVPDGGLPTPPPSAPPADGGGPIPDNDEPTEEDTQEEDA